MSDAEVYISAIKEMLARPKPYPKLWAWKILDRVRGGETLPPYVVQCALEVAGDAPAPTVPEERQPGED